MQCVRGGGGGGGGGGGRGGGSGAGRFFKILEYTKNS